MKRLELLIAMIYDAVFFCLKRFWPGNRRDVQTAVKIFISPRTEIDIDKGHQLQLCLR